MRAIPNKVAFEVQRLLRLIVTAQCRTGPFNLEASQQAKCSDL